MDVESPAKPQNNAMDENTEDEEDDDECDLYAVLGVPRDAAAKDIKKAYYKLVSIFNLTAALQQRTSSVACPARFAQQSAGVDRRRCSTTRTGTRAMLRALPNSRWCSRPTTSYRTSPNGSPDPVLFSCPRW